MINSIITTIMNKLNKKLVAALLLVIMIIVFIVWLIDAAVNKRPQYESLANFLKVINTTLPILLEGI